MKKGYLPYYISRALLSALFAVLIAGFTWKAIIITVVFFGFFLLYLHSGWFMVDAENALLPLRRDTRGQLVQRKALIVAVVVGLLSYFLLAFLSGRLGLTLLSGNIALALAVIAYFSSQFIFFSRA
jgi:hypothetical protein